MLHGNDERLGYYFMLTYIPNCPAMKDAMRHCSGTRDNALPMPLRLSFKSQEKEVVRWPD